MSTEQVSNGKDQEQKSVPANAIRNIAWLNLFKCCSQIATSKLVKNTGTPNDPKMIERYFSPEQIARVVRIKRLIRPYYEELYDLEDAFEQQKAEISKRTLQVTRKAEKDAKDDEELRQIALETQRIVLDYQRKINQREKELPAEIADHRFKLADLDGFSITGNEFADMFWEYLVDID